MKRRFMSLTNNNGASRGPPYRRMSGFFAKDDETISKAQKRRFPVSWKSNNSTSSTSLDDSFQPNDSFNYALLIILYTLQGIPMGLSASIPFLLQERITKMSSMAASAASSSATTTAAAVSSSAAASYNANAIFALCSWPFSLKLLWAPIVDAVYFKKFGRRKSWLVPVQMLAGALLWGGANFVEDQLGLASTTVSTDPIDTNVRGVTSYFFILYFLMATQDIAVDGWALTMLSKKNRGKGPVCNSIGQNIGFFLSFVGFLAFNDVEASETIWRPLLGLPSNPTKGLISLKGFLKFMGAAMIVTTICVAIWKQELPTASSGSPIKKANDKDEDEGELDAAELGLRETYKRLWAVCQLPSVRLLFLILITYRLPTSLSDNVKFLKAVELGLSKSTTAILSPTVILPLGILVPIAAHHIWKKDGPLRQFATAYQWRVTVIPLLDMCMLRMIVKSGNDHGPLFWLAILGSTAGQAICNSLQFNAQMIFFASRVDPAIGGSYMTLLNTAANLGGTWPSSFVMALLGFMTKRRQEQCVANLNTVVGGIQKLTCNTDPYYLLQILFSILGVGWFTYFSPKLRTLSSLPDSAWRTKLMEDKVDLEDIEKGDLWWSSKSHSRKQA